MGNATFLLEGIEPGDPATAEQLLPLLYDDLRRLAAHKLAREKPGQTFDATALVHEAYLRLVRKGEDKHWDSRGHFFAAAAEAMRRILIDQARRKGAGKHGGGRRRVSLDEANCLAAPDAPPLDDLLALDAALRELETEEPVKAQLVKLRYFAGLTNEQAAQALGISTSTADNDWAYARSWLRLAMMEE